jgi:hypothetical protein
MLTDTQIVAGQAVHRALERAEEAHPNSLALHRLHLRLAALRDAFQADMPEDHFVAFGGGTPKTSEE